MGFKTFLFGYFARRPRTAVVAPGIGAPVVYRRRGLFSRFRGMFSRRRVVIV